MDEYECEGEGSCLKECECSYLKGTNDCTCYFEYNHRHFKTETKRFCVKLCKYGCVLKDCKTFNYCQESYPEWYFSDNLLTTNDQCNSCGMFKVKFPNEVDNCYLCFENKYLIETYCRHRFCIECLIQLNPDKDASDNPCPFCKQNIEFTPID
jgi:hypothetical protein